MTNLSTWTRAGVALLFFVSTEACAPTLSQPFSQWKGSAVTVYRLQNYEPPQQTANASPLPLPPQIQQLINGAGTMIPPGLLPPGLLPGSTATAAASDAQKFNGFRILGWMALTDETSRQEVLDLLGHEANFQTAAPTCMYAEFGFSIAQPGAPQPADVLVSLSCEQVQAFNFAWPYSKTGVTADSAKRVVAIAQKAFGG